MDDLLRKAAELAATLAEAAPAADLRHWIDDLGRRQVLVQALADATERRQLHTTALLHQVSPREESALRALGQFRERALVFTHHQHLLELARLSLPASALACSIL